MRLTGCNHITSNSFAILKRRCPKIPRSGYLGMLQSALLSEDMKRWMDERSPGRRLEAKRARRRALHLAGEPPSPSGGPTDRVSEMLRGRAKVFDSAVRRASLRASVTRVAPTVPTGFVIEELDAGMLPH